MIIGADGVKSIVRNVVVGRPDHAEATGDAAYRAIIPTEVMLKDPDLKPFADIPEMTAWMGPKRHVMTYCIVSLGFRCLIEFILNLKRIYIICSFIFR